MVYDDLLKARAESSMVQRVEAISERTGLDHSEVLRRLVRLGLSDVEEVGDEVLLGTAATDTSTEEIEA